MRKIPVEVSNLQQFFSGIEDRLNQSRKVQEDSVKGFFTELPPRLETARKLDEEMNRVFAHRFNVLDYMRTDELGLSRIIADLFNPKASHGQGTFFLKSFLTRLINESNCTVDEKWLGFEKEHVRVHVEKMIKDSRRIDIYVTIERKSDSYCLAIENKPYADDQERQVADYLNHLDGNYNNENFLLIYLPSKGQFPSEFSLPRNEYKCWTNRFKVMAYHNEWELVESESTKSDDIEEQRRSEDAENDIADYRISYSLADWFSECRKNLEVDRLRSFLLDAKQFCEKRFGDNTMVDNSRSQVVEEYIFSDPEANIDTARIVAECWPHIRDRICRDFFAHLRKEIKSKLDSNLKLQFREDAKSKKLKQIFIHSDSWGIIENEFSKGIAVGIESRANPTPNNWFMGIQIRNFVISGASKEKGHVELIDKIEEVIKKENLMASTAWKKDFQHKWWQLRCYLDESKRDWLSLLPKLRKETKNKGGKVTDYYVNNFVRLAQVATPIIQ